MSETRLVAIMGGGDWADASVEHLRVPTGTTMSDIQVAWRKWYAESYCPALHRNERPQYYGLAEFAVQFHGAEYADREDIEEFWDT